METVQNIVAFLEPWWPFVAKVGTLWFLQQVMKKRVWTKGRADRNGFVKFMRATMIVHPVAMGVLWGLCYPWLPASAIVTTVGAAINEGVLAGLASVIGYKALEATGEYYVKRNPDSKWHIVLRVLRETVKSRETKT